MKAHKQSKKDPFKPACMKAFSKITAQNFEILTNEQFENRLKMQPETCCQKCLNKF